MSDQETDERRQAAGDEPGFNPLFAGVLLALAAGIVAGALAGDETLLRSNLVFRFAVGGVVAAVLYVACAALWRAWHRRLLKLRIAGQGLDPGDEGNADEVRKRDLEVAEFMGTTTNAIAELTRRIEALERER